MRFYPMTTLATRLETLITKINQATADVTAGKLVNAKALDQESLALHRDIKRSPSAELRPLLLKSITAIERLTEALERQQTK